MALVSLPHIFTEINRVISDPRSSAVHVADVISKDPNLTARLLRIVNSAFYGFPSKIDTISRAVTILGSKELSTLALGTSVLNIFNDIPADLVDMKSFWEHSVACGIAARMIGSYKNIANTERLFVAGLLHDIGRIIIYKYLPSEGREMLLYAQQTDCLLRSAEMEVLGFDHGQIGAMLMQKWKLPVILEQALGYHHQTHPISAPPGSRLGPYCRHPDQRPDDRDQRGTLCAPCDPGGVDRVLGSRQKFSPKASNWLTGRLPKSSIIFLTVGRP